MTTPCVLCAIADHQAPATVHHEDDAVLAIDPLHPMAPVHILLFPRPHASDLSELLTNDPPAVTAVMSVAHHLTVRLGLSESGYRLVWNVGPDTGQRIGHPHLHLLGGGMLTSRLA